MQNIYLGSRTHSVDSLGVSCSQQSQQHQQMIHSGCQMPLLVIELVLCSPPLSGCIFLKVNKDKNHQTRTMPHLAHTQFILFLNITGNLGK
jgi:hypothetical protein